MFEGDCNLWWTNCKPNLKTVEMLNCQRLKLRHKWLSLKQVAWQKLLADLTSTGFPLEQIWSKSAYTLIGVPSIQQSRSLLTWAWKATLEDLPNWGQKWIFQERCQSSLLWCQFQRLSRSVRMFLRNSPLHRKQRPEPAKWLTAKAGAQLLLFDLYKWS